MIFTDNLELTQYEAHDKVSFLDRYNKDMRIIDVATTSVSANVQKVENVMQWQIDNLVATTSIASGEIKDLQMKTESLESRTSTVERQVTDLFVTTASISAGLAEHIAETVSYNAGVMQKIEDNYNKLNGDILRDRERISVNETAIADHEEKLKNLDPNTNGVTRSIEALQSRMSTTEDDVISLQNKTSDLSKQASAADGNIAINTANISSLKTKMTAAEQNIEDLGKNTATNKGVDIGYKAYFEFDEEQANIPDNFTTKRLNISESEKISITGISNSDYYTVRKNGEDARLFQLELKIPDGYKILAVFGEVKYDSGSSIIMSFTQSIYPNTSAFPKATDGNNAFISFYVILFMIKEK